MDVRAFGGQRSKERVGVSILERKGRGLPRIARARFDFLLSPPAGSAVGDGRTCYEKILQQKLPIVRSKTSARDALLIFHADFHLPQVDLIMESPIFAHQFGQSFHPALHAVTAHRQYCSIHHAAI